MFSLLRRPPGIFALALLLLLLGVAAAKATPTLLPPAQTTAGTPDNDPASVSAPPDNTFTYQGTLKQAGEPVNGLCDFQFSLWDAAEDGNQVGVNDGQQLPVSEGIFTATLNVDGDLGDTPFRGEARWLQIAVRCPSGSGSYETLAPRQPLTPAPYAHSLRPGAVVEGTVPSGGATLKLASNGDGLVVNGGLNGISVGHANNDGIHICATGSETSCTLSGTNNGVEIGSAETYGVLVDSAVTGIFLGGLSDDGIYVGGAADDGMRVFNAGGVGVSVNYAGEDGLFVCRTGTETACTPSDTNNGLEVGNAEDHGIRVNAAGINGLYVDTATFNGVLVNDVSNRGFSVNFADEEGVYVHSAGDDGLYVNEAAVNGIDVTGAELAAHFRGTIQITGGSCSGCRLATFGVNAGQHSLEPGDIVTVQGAQPSGVDSVPILLEVAKASAGQPLIGVVEGWADVQVEAEPRPGAIGRRLIPREGAAEPGSYVSIIIYGPVQVQASDVTGAITPGARLAIDEDNRARTLQTVAVDGVQLAESAPVIGIALSAPDSEGLVWTLVNPQ